MLILHGSWTWTFDGFRRYAHARVITDFKNMADYEERITGANTEGFRKRRKRRKERLAQDYRRLLDKGRGARRNDSGLKHKTSLLIYCLQFALIKTLAYLYKGLH